MFIKLVENLGVLYTFKQTKDSMIRRRTKLMDKLGSILLTQNYLRINTHLP